MQVVLALGKKPKKGEKVSPELIDRVKKASELFLKRSAGVFVISGGKTRKDLDTTEAVQGLRCVDDSIPGDRIYLEPSARSTVENIVLTQDLLRRKGIYTTTLLVVTSSYHTKRTSFLLERLWPGVEYEIFGVGERVLFKEKIAEAILLTLARLDTREKWIFPILKMCCRNTL